MGGRMGLFRKSEERRKEERLQALAAAVMENSPEYGGPEEAAAFHSAVAELRTEGPAAEDMMLSVAAQGVPFNYLLNLWQGIYDMGDTVAPGVDRVLKTGVAQARAQAAMVLGTFAQESPAMRASCAAALREASAKEKDEAVLKVISIMLDKVTEIEAGGQ
jgi:hypothetical protein